MNKKELQKIKDNIETMSAEELAKALCRVTKHIKRLEKLKKLLRFNPVRLLKNFFNRK